MGNSVYDLREFLDKMPAVPCEPKKDDALLCSLCERLNPTVAQACKSGKKITVASVASEEEPKETKPKELTIEINVESAHEDEELVELEDEIPIVEGVNAKTSNINGKEVAIEVEPILVQTKEDEKMPKSQKERGPQLVAQKTPQKGTVVKVAKPQKIPQTVQSSGNLVSKPTQQGTQHVVTTPQEMQKPVAVQQIQKTETKPQEMQKPVTVQQIQKTEPNPKTIVQNAQTQQLQNVVSSQPSQKELVQNVNDDKIPTQRANIPVTQPTKFKKIVKTK
ncbi:MAG: hypothetical protein QXT63_01345 [Thermoplasmata archaeon]